jgi:hypothetical protein
MANSVTSIGGWGFYNCNSLASVTLSEKVTSIGMAAFMYCPNLTSIEIPAMVSEIYGAAFYECISLADVTVGWTTPLEVSEDIFDGINMSAATLHVPNGTTALYKAANVWKSFGKFVEYTPTGSTKIEVPALKAFASNGVLNISGLQPGKPVYIYSISGLLLYHGIAKAGKETIPLAWHGACIVVSEKQSVKVF